MPLFQKPVFYPPTTEDREAAAILAIRVRTRSPVGGGAPHQFLPKNALAGTKTSGGASINGGSFGPSNNAKFLNE